ncbi:MAG: hypothetical protein M0C28_16510 [Candidatus Moduliflexus flocculans]|nr:hypothetical protein [Candidatus Moduliflexus flocculans]
MLGISADDTVEQLKPFVARVQDELPGARRPGARGRAGGARAGLGPADHAPHQPRRQGLPHAHGAGEEGGVREGDPRTPVV